jgi:hypothetical protein
VALSATKPVPESADAEGYMNGFDQVRDFTLVGGKPGLTCGRIAANRAAGAQ